MERLVCLGPKYPSLNQFCTSNPSAAGVGNGASVSAGMGPMSTKAGVAEDVTVSEELFLEVNHAQVIFILMMSGF